MLSEARAQIRRFTVTHEYTLILTRTHKLTQQHHQIYLCRTDKTETPHWVGFPAQVKHPWRQQRKCSRLWRATEKRVKLTKKTNDGASAEMRCFTLAASEMTLRKVGLTPNAKAQAKRSKTSRAVHSIEYAEISFFGTHHLNCCTRPVTDRRPRASRCTRTALSPSPDSITTPIARPEAYTTLWCWTFSSTQRVQKESKLQLQQKAIFWSCEQILATISGVVTCGPEVAGDMTRASSQCQSGCRIYHELWVEPWTPLFTTFRSIREF